MPPHGAPLGMLYYTGDKFADLKDRLIVSLHGYKPTGSRVLAYDTDERGFPKVTPTPVRYNVSCARRRKSSAPTASLPQPRLTPS